LIRFSCHLAAALALAWAAAAKAQDPAAPEPPTPEPPAQITLGAAGLFHFAEAAEAQADFAAAETAYRALADDPDPEFHTEARFRLARLLADHLDRPEEAAVQLRRILAEKPRAGAVRLALARIEARLGHRGAAVRELRAADAAGLPQDVERMVRFFGNALSAAKPLGGSLELAAVADSNINRATGSGTLDTVLGDFVLGSDARARAGWGFSAQGQAYARTWIDQNAQLLGEASFSADFHPRRGSFDDAAAALRLGPEYHPGKDRLAFTAGPAWRWFGRAPYSRALSLSGTWQHPLGKRGQLRADGEVMLTDNLRNNLQDGTTVSLRVSFDRQLGARGGGGVQLAASRTGAQDRGYSDHSGNAAIYAFRALGRLSAVVSLGYGHLESDARLFLYPRRRIDDRVSLIASLTWRQSALARAAPFVRLRAERNRSTVELYAYRRLAAEIGLSSSF
jgi:hypothetical protein